MVYLPLVVILPIGSMYGIYANIWGILMVNVTIYTIHGSYGLSYIMLSRTKDGRIHRIHRIASSRLGMQRGGLPRESIAALHELLDVDPVRAIAWARIQWCSCTNHGSKMVKETPVDLKKSMVDG